MTAFTGVRDCRWLLALPIVLALAAPAGAESKGLQVSPDGLQRFVNKDVGTDERWAIAVNGDDDSVTGNVFFRNGSDPSFIVCAPSNGAGSFTCAGANSCAGPSASSGHGIQTSPDGRRVFVNKDVGDNERWAITLNTDTGGSITGNVFFRDGSDPSFIFCSPLPQPHAFHCLGANSCTTAVCTDQYRFIADVTVPEHFFDLPADTAVCASQYRFIATVDVPSSFFGGTATCGDGTRQGNEACDGDDRARCGDGECQSNCACVTSTPVTSTVRFHFDAAQPLTGIQVRAEYHPEQGSFDGLADGVNCTTSLHPLTAFNNCVAPGCHRGGSPTGVDSLLMALADATALPFPLDVTCSFHANAGQALAADDLHLVVEAVITDQGTFGNPHDLDVSMDIQRSL